jgi:hypothetical protein
MGKIDQERWILEQNIARFEDQLEHATDEKQRAMLRAMIAREQERHNRSPPVTGLSFASSVHVFLGRCRPGSGRTTALSALRK